MNIYENDVKKPKVSLCEINSKDNSGVQNRNKRFISEKRQIRNAERQSKTISKSKKKASFCG